MEKKILVIGDSCIDSYAYCKSTRLAPDKPVPVLEVLDTVNTPGMAYNVFRNVISCLLYTSPSPRDVEESRMPSSA